VVEVRTEQRAPDSVPYVFPDHCPVCGSLAMRPPGEVVVRCTGGLICSAQITERLRHFVGRDAFDIEGLGKKQVPQLLDEKLIAQPADIFHLSERREDLAKLPGWGDKKVDNLLRAIDARRSIALERFINALGIRFVGEANARLLARHYGSLAAWRGAMVRAQEGDGEARAELENIDGIGPKVAEAILEFFAEGHNRAALAALAGEVQVEDAVAPAAGSSPLAGKTVVFTGTLATVSRAEAKATAEAQGAKVAGSVSAKTDYVVVGADAGSKAKRAAELGVAILSEDEWREIAGIV
jgi:DNA ligase (NAD+)